VLGGRHINRIEQYPLHIAATSSDITQKTCVPMLPSMCAYVGVRRLREWDGAEDLLQLGFVELDFEADKPQDGDHNLPILAKPVTWCACVAHTIAKFRNGAFTLRDSFTIQNLFVSSECPPLLPRAKGTSSEGCGSSATVQITIILTTHERAVPTHRDRLLHYH